MAKRYGDPFRMPSMNGTLVITTGPDGARQILAGRAEDDFVVGFGVDAIAPIIGTGSLLLSSGDRHRATASSSPRPSTARACGRTAR